MFGWCMRESSFDSCSSVRSTLRRSRACSAARRGGRGRSRVRRAGAGARACGAGLRLARPSAPATATVERLAAQRNSPAQNRPQREKSGWLSGAACWELQQAQGREKRGRRSRRGGGRTNMGEMTVFLITHGERGRPSRGERSSRYTDTPEPLAILASRSEQGTTSDFRRRSDGGVADGRTFAGVHSAGEIPDMGVCGMRESGCRVTLGTSPSGGFASGGECATPPVMPEGVGGVVIIGERAGDEGPAADDMRQAGTARAAPAKSGTLETG
eukprot:1066653-Prymnesium_polylepis.1